MPRRSPRLTRLRRTLARGLERVALVPFEVLAQVLPALPERAVLAFSDVLGAIFWALDARGRRAGMQNLEAVFGDALSPRERRRTLRASYRNTLQAEVLLFHLRHLTPARYAHWVRIAPEDEVRLRALVRDEPAFVLVSGHVGNWELLLAARHLVGFCPPTSYLAETTGSPRVDAFLAGLRDRGSGSTGLRKGGAMALRKALEQGRAVSLLVDRNVPSRYGGVYVPFLGLPARTTPLPAMLAHWYGVALAVAVLLPEGRARWRLWVSGDLMEPRTGDEATDVPRGLARMNDVLSRVIREHPTAWAWMLKRWKSRPTPELGPYPAYSVHDPDGGRRGRSARAPAPPIDA